jgi:hypothetical protein
VNSPQEKGTQLTLDPKGADQQRARGGGSLQTAPRSTEVLRGIRHRLSQRGKRGTSRISRAASHGEVGPARPDRSGKADAPNSPIDTLPHSIRRYSMPDTHGTSENKPSAGIAPWVLARIGRVSCESLATRGKEVGDGPSQAFDCRLPGSNLDTPASLMAGVPAFENLPLQDESCRQSAFSSLETLLGPSSQAMTEQAFRGNTGQRQ